MSHNISFTTIDTKNRKVEPVLFMKYASMLTNFKYTKKKLIL
jgi:hypothetical protein